MTPPSDQKLAPKIYAEAVKISSQRKADSPELNKDNASSGVFNEKNAFLFVSNFQTGEIKYKVGLKPTMKVLDTEYTYD